MNRKNIITIIIAVLIMAFGLIIGSLSRYNILEKIFSVLLVTTILALIYDTYFLFKDKRYFGKAKWIVKSTNNTLLLTINLYCILIPALSIDSKDSLHTMLISIIFVSGLIPFFHSILKDGINEKGIFHWGILYTWDKIQSYSFTDNFLVIALNSATNKIKLIVKKEDKENIKLLLKEHIKR
ncbi:DUF5673 domain-containing protein [Thermoanaerobacterium sp. R66]|uniref:DUF5673 domain-containing protein n=1 Tax=Thermoanaerobacterium sp. R66 TaxID=2742479 RepID=UPI002380C196|nr:DUF5673 domain-containing protein [Thermoanaerobacterium sp. R66]MDE4542904.1 hypothetical protein [Thermoanaerobacterium sp. R66]